MLVKISLYLGLQFRVFLFLPLFFSLTRFWTCFISNFPEILNVPIKDKTRAFSLARDFLGQTRVNRETWILCITMWALGVLRNDVGDKEKSWGKTPINRKKKSPPILASECNKSETQTGTRSSLCEQTLWQKGRHGQEEGTQGGSGAAHGRSSRLKARDGEQLGAHGRYTHTRINTIFLWKMQTFPAFKKPNCFIFLGWVK